MDWYDSNYYANSISTNPQGPASGQYRAVRGGSWDYNVSGTRSAYRYGGDPASSLNGRGFRCALSK
ncbi:MAG: SUMF1/EgtB/PvdO family nonheme iron enzyme [Chloroflexota bacterium]